MNRLILGTAQMGLDYGVNNSSGKISFENSCEILLKAFEIGIDTLDTAESYGNAHQVIGDFHKLFPNFKFKIVTKIPTHVDLDIVENKIKKYIDDLKVSYLDVLMFHSFETYQKNKHELIILTKLKNQGLIKNIGVSAYTNEQIEILLLDDEINFIQLPYNLLDNENLRGDIMYRLKEKGKIVQARSAFLQGLFFINDIESNEVSKELLFEFNTINKIAREEGTTISNLALSYCLNNKKIDQVLMGVDSLEQLIENSKAVKYQISEKSLSKINEIKIKNIELLNPSLWK